MQSEQQWPMPSPQHQQLTTVTSNHDPSIKIAMADELIHILTPTQKLRNDRRFFAAIPWCNALLTAPDTIIVRPGARVLKEHHVDTMWRTTFLVADGIRAYMSISRPLAGVPGEREALVLVAFGMGLTGHIGILHGGAVATLFDDAFTEAAVVPCLTAYLHVTYKKPVPAPSVVLCKVQIIKRERRKRLMKGTIEDEFGTVFAEAESLFVTMAKESKL